MERLQTFTIPGLLKTSIANSAMSCRDSQYLFVDEMVRANYYYIYVNYDFTKTKRLGANIVCI